MTNLWISCADHLPKEGLEVWAWWKDNKRGVAVYLHHYTDGPYAWISDECNVIEMDEVTHWMLLPEGPE